MTEKAMIRVSIEDESPNSWPADIDKIIERLTELKSRVKLKPGERLDLEFVKDYYYPYDHNPSPMFVLYHVRLETDEEAATRIAAWTEQTQRQAEFELKEFQRLSAKFNAT